MLIKVRYENGHLGTVPSSSLEQYIANKEIRAFYRSDGWATIGVDPIRKGGKKMSPDSARRESDRTDYYRL